MSVIKPTRHMLAEITAFTQVRQSFAPTDSTSGFSWVFEFVSGYMENHDEGQLHFCGDDTISNEQCPGKRIPSSCSYIKKGQYPMNKSFVFSFAFGHH